MSTIATAGAAQTPVTGAGAAPPQEYEGPAVSPRGAFFRSVVLPGWGQAYVGVPGRGAVYFTLAGGSVWMAYLARRQLQDARREQDWLLEAGRLQPTAETDLVSARERHFEDWAAMSIFLFFVSGADAYVAAYLADFDERIRIGPSAQGALQFEAKLPVGRRP